MIKKGTIAQDRTLGNKLDGNKVHNYQLAVQKFNAKNQYDKFSIITNREPSSKVYMATVPDYVTLTYSCMIFTDYIEHMNKMIEAINFASDSYWGDPNRYKFRTIVSPFAPTTEVTTDDSRVIKTTFDLTLHGYIIPDTINRAMATNNLYYGTSQLVFNFETTTADLDTYDATAKVISKGGSTTIFEGGSNITVNNISDSELQNFINDLQNQSSKINSTTFTEYKGFRFAIKEEETLGAQQAIVVRGNIKRRYAVAINKDGIEVLKSELSFTLDPTDLVEQLKIIIDQQNLQA
jgi:hypothetical protein